MPSGSIRQAARSSGTWVALGLILIGGYWVFEALRIGVWFDGQPASGFLPLVYGALLIVFSGLALRSWQASDEEAGGIGKPLAIVAIILVTVLGLEVVGAAAGLFLMMFVIFVFIERFAVLKSFIVSAAVAGVLILVFRVWLGAPLPRGLLGL